MNLAEAQDSADVARRAYVSVGAFIEGLQPTVIWLGPGLVALGLLAAGVRLACLVQCRQLRRVDLPIGLALVMVLLYVNKSAGWFPKYQVVLAPLLACVAAPLIAALSAGRPRLAVFALAASALASGGVALALARDRWALERTWAIAPEVGGWLLGIVLAAGLIGIVWRAPAASAGVALLGVALGWSLGVDAVQVVAPYQTDYWYGTSGTLEAANWVNANLRADQTYAASKEVAIHSGQLRYVDQDNLVSLLRIGQPLESTWAGEPLHALVILERDPYIADLFERSTAAAGFATLAVFGDYVVYVPAS